MRIPRDKPEPGVLRVAREALSTKPQGEVRGVWAGRGGR